jgi:hypothetical protein
LAQWEEARRRPSKEKSSRGPREDVLVYVHAGLSLVLSNDEAAEEAFVELGLSASPFQPLPWSPIISKHRIRGSLAAQLCWYEKSQSHFEDGI